jgi:aminoglycoside phosphotransferase (APT) family kinase protein
MNEKAMVLGDCWTGAILVGIIEDNPTVGVIDWEFASIGRGVDGDMAQFLAHI